jgi:hypothetical protein
MSAAIHYLKQLHANKTNDQLLVELNQALHAEEDAVDALFEAQKQMEEIYTLVAAVMTRGTVGQQDYKDLKAVKEIARKYKGKS